MDFFDQARKMVMETVGLQESVAPDPEFEKWNEHLKKIDGMAVILRRHFTAYAASIVEMVRVFQTACTFATLSCLRAFLSNFLIRRIRARFSRVPTVPYVGRTVDRGRQFLCQVRIAPDFGPPICGCVWRSPGK